MEEAFGGVDIRDYWINIPNKNTVHTCTVSRMKSTDEYTVRIPTKDMMGSRFGLRTCGKPTKYGVPCKNMVAIVKNVKERRIEPNSDHAVLADMCALVSTIHSSCKLPD